MVVVVVALLASSLLLAPSPSLCALAFTEGELSTVDPSAETPLQIFTDVTDYAIPEEWRKPKQLGSDYLHFPPPSLIDFDGDGTLDIITPNHHSAFKGEDPARTWNVGLNRLRYSKELRALDIYQNGPSGGWYRDITKEIIVAEEEYDPETGETGKNVVFQMDCHGIALMNINSDNFTDFFCTTGTIRGVSYGVDMDANLFVGRYAPTSSRREDGSSTFPRQLWGGRPMAAKWGLNLRDERTKGAYFLDADLDGKLDMFPLNDIRFAKGDTDNRFGLDTSDEPLDKAEMLHVPGRLHRNKGDNSPFQVDESLSEYSATAILTDADGDGVANEFVVGRWRCKHDDDRRYLYTYPPEWKEFCGTRPRGSFGIYRWSQALDRFEDVSPIKYTNAVEPNGTSDTLPYTIQSGDLDGDGRNDLAVLFNDRVDLYYSRGLAVGEMVIGHGYGPSEQLRWNATEDCRGKSLRVRDFDNDGKLEMLVLCLFPLGAHRFYRQRSVEQQEGVSALNGEVQQEKSISVNGSVWDDDNMTFYDDNKDDDNSGSTGAGDDGDGEGGREHDGSLIIGEEELLGGMRGVSFIWERVTENLGALADARIGLASNSTCAPCAYNSWNIWKCTEDRDMVTKRLCKEKADGRKTFAKSLTIADVDNDGYPDAMVAHHKGKVIFMKNNYGLIHPERRFIAFKLVGVKNNVHGIGCVLKLTVVEEDSETRPSTQILYQEYNTHNHETDELGSKDPRIFFGLGSTLTPIHLEVTWPDGHKQYIDNKKLLRRKVGNLNDYYLGAPDRRMISIHENQEREGGDR